MGTKYRTRTLREQHYAVTNDRILLQIEQITAEFKVLALQHHPDKNDGDKEAEAMFQKLKVRITSFNFILHSSI